MKLSDTAFAKRTAKNSDILKIHPCYSKEAHHKFGRIHLPVAPRCNIQCRYCQRNCDCANEAMPGITSNVLSPREALERARSVVDRNDNIGVIGITGPGEPLVNDETFTAISMIRRELPELILCVSTNGLVLTERIEALIKAGVRSLTITINAVTPGVAEKIYSRVSYNGRSYTGKEASRLIVANQWRGLRNAIDAGFIVKVNTVFIPGINDAEIPLIAWGAGKMGVDIMNIMPLIPQAEFVDLQRPTREMMERKRSECYSRISGMSSIRQCRDGACGMPGEDKEMGLEVLNTGMGEDYCEAVC